MKRFILIAMLLVSLTSVDAQSKKSSQEKQTTTTAMKKANMNSTKPDDAPISLVSTNAYAAKANSAMTVRTYYSRITDPTVLALIERARGNEVFVSSSGIVGMPKRAYGFANGAILFRSTVATSSGSTGGNSSVGCGGSISGIGSGGSFIGLNGKSPYAGLGMWGTSQGLSFYSLTK
jgi:hypothetical protein